MPGRSDLAWPFFGAGHRTQVHQPKHYGLAPELKKVIGANGANGKALLDDARADQAP